MSPAARVAIIVGAIAVGVLVAWLATGHGRRRVLWRRNPESGRYEPLEVAAERWRLAPGPWTVAPTEQGPSPAETNRLPGALTREVRRRQRRSTPGENEAAMRRWLEAEGLKSPAGPADDPREAATEAAQTPKRGTMDRSARYPLEVTREECEALRAALLRDQLAGVDSSGAADGDPAAAHAWGTACLPALVAELGAAGGLLERDRLRATGSPRRRAGDPQVPTGMLANAGAPARPPALIIDAGETPPAEAFLVGGELRDVTTEAGL